MMHAGNNPYMCSDCGKGFTELINLKSHLKTHTGEYADQQEIQVKTESGTMYSSCATCVEGFVLLQDLHNHILTVSH